MRALSRAARLLAGLFVVLLTIPLALSTPWAKAVVFERATSWARSRFGVDVRAATFDYSLLTLRVSAEELSVTDLRTPDQPLARVGRVDVDLAASALRGRLDFDGISARDVQLAIDLTPGPRRPSAAAIAGSEDVRLPPFSIDRLQVENLDLALQDEDLRLDLNGVSADLHGGRRRNTLEGALAATRGAVVSFQTDAIRVTFERADAQVALEDNTRVAGTMRAASPVAALRAEGRVPLSLDGSMNVQYDGTLDLAQSGRWWRDSPAWSGRAAIAGNVTGRLRAPDASFRVTGRDLAWSELARATVDAVGHVSSKGLTVESASLASRGATLSGGGTLAFRRTERSEFSGRWTNLGTDVVAGLFGHTFAAVSRTTIAGTTTFAWQGPRPGPGAVEGHLEATSRGAGQDETATGQINASGRDGAWRIEYRQDLAGDTSVAVDASIRADPERIVDSPLSGSVSLQGRDISAALAQLHRLGLLPPVEATTIASKHLAFDGVVSGTLGDPRASGTVAAYGVHGGPVDDAELSGTLSVDTRALSVAPLRVNAEGNRATFQGRLPWREGTGAGTFTVRVAEPARLAPLLPDSWTPSGVIDASGEWAGTLRALQARARLDGSGVAANGVGFDTLTATASFTGRLLTIDGLHATQPGGSVTGSGAWDFTDRALRADLTATTLDLALRATERDRPPATRARVEDVSIEAHLTGTLDHLDGTLTVRAASAEFDGRALGAVSATAAASGGRARISASAPAFGATLEGAVTLEASWPFEGRLTVAGADVAAIGRLAGADETLLADVRASVDATLDARGRARELAAADATLSLTRIDGALRGQSVSLAEPGRLQISDGQARMLEPMRLTLGSTTTLRLAEPIGAAPQPGIAATLEGTLDELTALVPELLPEGLTAAGSVHAELVVDHRITDPRPTGEMTLANVSLKQGDRELARDLTVRAEADLEQIRVPELRGVVLGGPLEAEGAVPASWLWAEENTIGSNGDVPATFRVAATVAVGAVLSAFGKGAPDVAGNLGVTLAGTATAPRLSAVQATLRGQGGSLTAGAFTLSAPGGTAVRLEDGRVHVDTFHWTGSDSDVDLTGTLGVADGVDGLLHLKGNAALGLLTLFIPARVDGRAAFDLDVSGPRGAREVLGTIGVDDGTMVVPAWRLSMVEWSGRVVLGADSIEVQQLRGQFNGGQATIEGRLPLLATTADDRVKVTVRSAFLDVPQGLRSQLDADLEWSRGPEVPRLTGSVTVTARPYREPVTEMARLVSGLIDGSRGAPLALPSALATTELDVHLSTVGPLAMTNSIARVETLPDLQLIGTMSQPALRGQVVVVDDGRIQFGGRQYRLRDSRLEFSPDQGLRPRLAVGGETRVGDYTVFLRLSGPVNEIETALSSDPPLGERDLQTLLVTGQREELGRGSSSDQNAVGAVSGDVLGFAGQFLGFDAVTVSTTDDLALVSSDVDPALRLTVSKRIGRRFELVLSDNLDDNELTWVIIYRPRPGFEFRVVSRDNTEFTGEFRQEIFFGPGVSPPRTAARRAPARDRIAAVTVSGNPGFPPGVVLAPTELRAGDRFEFSGWLEDRDRIARFYRDRGYLAVRIIPTREDVAAADGERRVSLNYRITRGPQTILAVRGYSAPPPVIERLQQAWADSVLLELLDTDLERVMREHLIEEGYLRAAIAVNVDQRTIERITAVITVDPGPLSTERRVAFSGNRALDEETLLAAAAAQEVLASAWIDPAPLLSWVESTYVARGYLAVKVAARPIAHAGSLATLPVVIEEGPLARVATVSISGASRVSEADALKATGLAPGSPYLSGSEQVARLALERYYRTLGYRDVAIDARAAASAGEGRVDIALSLTEGPQYIVQAVRTTGVESTRDSVVARATRMEPGSPASPALAESTRRQLYDVGTFRSATVTFEPVTAGASADIVPVDAVVSVQESKRFLFLYGLETTSQYQSLFDQRVTTGGVAADLRDRNFLGRGWTLGAGLRYEPSFESARVLMAIPRIGSKRIRTNVYANTSSEERARTEDVIFRDDETTLTIEQRWRARRAVELSWGYRYDYRNLRFISAEKNEDLLDFNGYLAGLTGAVVLDRRDNLFDARRGWLVSATAEWGLQPLGSDFDYLRTVARGSYYLPLGPLTFASNVRWGDLFAINGRPPITVLDIFFTAGGTQTVRGYKQDSLSAYYLDPDGYRVPVGGTKLLVLNEEVRFPLFWLFSGAGFLDVGNTFTAEKGIVLGDLAVGAGIGLRIRTPLAPVRLDLGFPVRSSTGQTSIRWHFSIGQIF